MTDHPLRSFSNVSWLQKQTCGEQSTDVLAKIRFHSRLLSLIMNRTKRALYAINNRNARRGQVCAMIFILSVTAVSKSVTTLLIV